MGAKEDGEQYLIDNAKHDDVQVTASGLQYTVKQAGDGPKPGPMDTVEVHYYGTFINNKTFDSSYDRGEPTSFPVGGVIPGWTEALLLMSTGSKWELYVPPELAYGERGMPPVIPSHATLIFEIELLGIEN